LVFVGIPVEAGNELITEPRYRRDLDRRDVAVIGDFVLFLTEEGDPVRRKRRRIIKGNSAPMPEGNVSITRIDALEEVRSKQKGGPPVMPVDYLKKNTGKLPNPRDVEQRKRKLAKDIRHREPGGDKAEAAQNIIDPIDETPDKKGELVYDYGVGFLK